MKSKSPSTPSNRTAARAATLDTLDWKIIELLQLEGRIGWSELGRRVGLSQPAISERVKRLESAGVIEGYGARVNRQALGLDLMAVVRVRTTFDKLQLCQKLFASLPEVLEVHRVTGEDCFVLKVVVARAAALETVIDRLAQHGSVSTSLVMSSAPAAAIRRRILEDSSSP